MKKHLRNWLGLFCFALLACLWGAAPLQAAGNTVLVLPFQVTAGPEMPNAAQDVPQIIGTEMQQRGLSVIPMDKARSLLSSRGGSIDMAAARELGKKAGADLVLFGSFKQNGEGFALQSLLVPVNEGQAKPANFDRPSLLSLNECAAAMAGQASGMLAGAAAAARYRHGDLALKFFVFFSQLQHQGLQGGASRNVDRSFQGGVGHIGGGIVNHGYIAFFRDDVLSLLARKEL